MSTLVIVTIIVIVWLVSGYIGYLRLDIKFEPVWIWEALLFGPIALVMSIATKQKTHFEATFRNFSHTVSFPASEPIITNEKGEVISKETNFIDNIRKEKEKLIFVLEKVTDDYQIIRKVYIVEKINDITFKPEYQYIIERIFTADKTEYGVLTYNELETMYNNYINKFHTHA